MWSDVALGYKLEKHKKGERPSAVWASPCPTDRYARGFCASSGVLGKSFAKTHSGPRPSLKPPICTPIAPFWEIQSLAKRIRLTVIFGNPLRPPPPPPPPRDCRVAGRPFLDPPKIPPLAISPHTCWISKVNHHLRVRILFYVCCLCVNLWSFCYNLVIPFLFPPPISQNHSFSL